MLLKKIFKPVIRFLYTFADFAAGIFGIKPDDQIHNHSEEEIKNVILEGRRSGVIDQTEHQLIERIFDFNEKRAKDIMIPRSYIAALNINDPRDKIFRVVAEEGYSRLPVYKDTIDNIIGVIYTKDLISAAERGEPVILADIIRQAFFVSATKQIGVLMKEFQKEKLSMGIVINEFGGVEGLITMEDIIEEIVGEIQDEYDQDYSEIKEGAGGEYFIDPIISIKNFNTSFKAAIPEDPFYNTVGGFLCKVTGHIPELFERIDYESCSFVITKKQGNAMKQIKVIKK